jgi:hypothetical protein
VITQKVLEGAIVCALNANQFCESKASDMRNGSSFEMADCAMCCSNSIALMSGALRGLGGAAE